MSALVYSVNVPFPPDAVLQQPMGSMSKQVPVAGDRVGACDCGARVVIGRVGVRVGSLVGTRVGTLVGTRVGVFVGSLVGDLVGDLD